MGKPSIKQVSSLTLIFNIVMLLAFLYLILSAMTLNEITGNETSMSFESSLSWTLLEIVFLSPIIAGFYSSRKGLKSKDRIWKFGYYGCWLSLAFYSIITLFVYPMILGDFMVLASIVVFIQTVRK